jgi:hypothetical protein
MPWPLLRYDDRSRPRTPNPLVDHGELGFSSSAHPPAKKQVQFSSTESPGNYNMPSKIHHELQASYRHQHHNIAHPRLNLDYNSKLSIDYRMNLFLYFCCWQSSIKLDAMQEH